MQDLAADEDIEARLRAAAAAGDESLRETALALAAELCERGDATGEQAAALAMYKSAERAALTALEHLPNCPTLLAMVGRARVRCADRSSDKKDKLATLAAAVEILDRALRLDPDDPAALIYRGVTFKIGGDLEASSAAKCEAYGRSESFFRRVL